MRSELASDARPLGLRRWTLLLLGIAVVLADLSFFTTGQAAHSPWRIAMGAGALLVAFLLSGRRGSAVGLRAVPQPSLRFWIRVVVILAVGSILLLAAGAAWFWYRGEPLPAGQFRGPADVWPAFTKSVLLAPVSEELVYRAVLCLPLRVVLGPWLAIMISGAAFAYLHVAYGNFAPNHVFAGLVMSWAYVRSGCLWLPILLHALGNLQVFLLNLTPWSWA